MAAAAGVRGNPCCMDSFLCVGASCLLSLCTWTPPLISGGRLWAMSAAPPCPERRLVAQAGESSEQELGAGRVKAEGLHMLHRYDEPVQVDITARLGGTETQRVLVLEIRRRWGGKGSADRG